MDSEAILETLMFLNGSGVRPGPEILARHLGCTEQEAWTGLIQLGHRGLVRPADGQLTMRGLAAAAALRANQTQLERCA